MPIFGFPPPDSNKGRPESVGGDGSQLNPSNEQELVKGVASSLFGRMVQWIAGTSERSPSISDKRTVSQVDKMITGHSAGEKANKVIERVSSRLEAYGVWFDATSTSLQELHALCEQSPEFAQELSAALDILDGLAKEEFALLESGTIPKIPNPQLAQAVNPVIQKLADMMSEERIEPKSTKSISRLLMALPSSVGLQNTQFFEQRLLADGFLVEDPAGGEGNLQKFWDEARSEEGRPNWEQREGFPPIRAGWQIEKSWLTPSDSRKGERLDREMVMQLSDDREVRVTLKLSALPPELSLEDILAFTKEYSEQFKPLNPDARKQLANELLEKYFPKENIDPNGKGDPQGEIRRILIDEFVHPAYLAFCKELTAFHRSVEL